MKTGTSFIPFLFGILTLSLLGFVPALTSAEPQPPPEEEEEYEPPPEGFEERHYSINDLTSQPTDFPRSENTPASANCPSCPFAEAPAAKQSLTAEEVIQIVKICAAPDTWRKGGPARISAAGNSLVILQKKEIHEEIGKVLRWLREGVHAPMRVTVVAAALKPDVLDKFINAPAPAASADMIKLLNDAGAPAPAQVIELRGFEGQKIVNQSVEEQRYIQSYSISGAEYDPAMQRLLSGLRLDLMGFRSPDCKSVYIGLNADLDRDTDLKNTARIVSTLVGYGRQQNATENKTDEEKKKTGTEKPEPPAASKSVAGEEAKTLKITLPASTKAGLHFDAMAPQNKFVLVGTVDLSLSSQEPKPEYLAFFVRVAIGAEEPPALVGVGGLKAGEIFRLYPVGAITRAIADYPGPDFQLFMAMAQGAPQANAFAVAPAPTTDNQGVLHKAKLMFQEKVRKDKLVEPMGPVIFTRLNEAGHQKLVETLESDVKRHAVPLRLHAVALALSVEAFNKLSLADAKAFDSADISALSGVNGAQSLMNERLSLMAGQRTHVFAGRHKSYLGEYNIVGDSYEPVVLEMFDRGFVLDVRPEETVSEQSLDVELRFNMIPHPSSVARTALEGYQINNGADVACILSMNADLDLPKIQIVKMRQTVNVPLGKYALAGAAPMPKDENGKPDPRQLVLFLKVE